MQLKQMQPLVIVLYAVCLVCNAFSPFKNRGSGMGTGVMMNTANPPPNLFTPILSSHGHGGIRPQNYIFGDKFPQYQTPVSTIFTINLVILGHINIKIINHANPEIHLI